MDTSEDRAFRAVREMGRMSSFFPILPTLGNRWAASRPWEGRTIAVNMHLTTLASSLLRELVLGGGTFVVSAASSATTDKGVVEYLRTSGIEVYTGGDLGDPHLEVLEHKPDLIVDVGFKLVDTLLRRRPEQARTVRAVVEPSRSGIARLRDRGEVPFPVINISDGRLKNGVENRHGTGEAIWQAVVQLTGMHLSGRRVAVIGYGPVGKGLAAYARAGGASVEVVERDPVRRLVAHYDGYPTPGLTEALERAGIVVTATGAARVLTIDHLTHARDGLVVLNAGHGGDEVDIEGIRRGAVRVDHVADHVVRYRLEGGNRLVVLADGHPLNIVMNSGSPEPVLLHFSVVGLALEWAARNDPPAGELVVPDEIEDRAAALALEALDLIGR